MANSHGMNLVEHELFESKEAAIREEKDIISATINVEKITGNRLRVADTDIGKEIKVSIEQLEQLLDAYRSGLIVQKEI